MEIPQPLWATCASVQSVKEVLLSQAVSSSILKKSGTPSLALVTVTDESFAFAIS